jgi:glycosyltransferase involved in cell wall biosynthesis
MDPLKVVQVTPFFGSRSYGGTERYVSNLSAELANRGHHIDVFTTKSSTKIPYQSYYKNMTVHRFYSPWNVFGINPACFMLHKMLQLKDVDVFHVHSYIYFTTIQAAIAKLLKRTPMLLHIHGGVGRPPYKTGFLKEFAKVFFDYTLGKFVLSQADIIASVSLQDSKLLEETIHSNLDRIIIVNNAINPDNFPEITPKLQNELIISYVGDLEPWKGIPYYSRVIDKLIRKTKNISFWFVGDGSLFSALESKFKNEKRVKLFGAVEHRKIPTILKKTHILIQPSFWEGSPTTIIEAMAMGIPVLASNIGDIPRLLDDGKNGILFEAGNEELLVDVILDASKNYTKLVDSARKARKKIRTDFAFGNVTNQIESLYYKLIS